MFANKYLTKNNNTVLIPENPTEETGIIVVIPCFREPDVVQTLSSLKQCVLPKSVVEVIVLINHSEVADNELKYFNRNTKNELDNWIELHTSKQVRFYAVGPVELKKKWAGAGLARKHGMDEAVRRFSYLNKPDGIIVSLDADTLVEPNYFIEIEQHFALNRKDVGATLAFEHQKEGLEKRQAEGIELYESYLQYYKRALEYTGYPFSMFTIGSAFAVTALAYVKRGGMNRRQAGEDFYFLQNLVQIGSVGEIVSTKVYPSARLSDRVPFGTGPVLHKWMSGDEELMNTYCFGAFEDLRLLFKRRDFFYKIEEAKFASELEKLPNSVSEFVKLDNFWEDVADLNKNCSSLKSFQTRFYHKFNAFKVLKYLNFAHEHYYKKAALKEQIRSLNQKQQA